MVDVVGETEMGEAVNGGFLGERLRRNTLDF